MRLAEPGFLTCAKCSASVDELGAVGNRYVCVDCAIEIERGVTFVLEPPTEPGIEERSTGS